MCSTKLFTFSPTGYPNGFDYQSENVQILVYIIGNDGEEELIATSKYNESTQQHDVTIPKEYYDKRQTLNAHAVIEGYDYKPNNITNKLDVVIKAISKEQISMVRKDYIWKFKLFTPSGVLRTNAADRVRLTRVDASGNATTIVTSSLQYSEHVHHLSFDISEQDNIDNNYILSIRVWSPDEYTSFTNTIREFNKTYGNDIKEYFI